MQNSLGRLESLVLGDDLDFRVRTHVLHLVQAKVHREAIPSQLIDPSFLVDDGNRLIAQIREQSLQIVRGGGAVGKGDFDLSASLGVGIDLRSLVRQEVSLADPANSEGLVGLREIAVGSIEIMVRVGAFFDWLGAHPLQAAFERL